MLHFYGILALNQYERNYHFTQPNLNEIQRPQNISYSNQDWKINFHGSLIHKEKGELLLKKQRKSFKNEKEYLIALYSLVEKHIEEYISEDSFLLLDNGKEVFIHNSEPLYCVRNKEGELYISSDSDAFETNKISKLSEHSSFRFYNNNLKTL